MTTILQLDTEKKLDDSLINSIRELCVRHGVTVKLRMLEEEEQEYDAIPQEAIDEAERRASDPNARYVSRDQVSKGMRDILGV